MYFNRQGGDDAEELTGAFDGIKKVGVGGIRNAYEVAGSGDETAGDDLIGAKTDKRLKGCGLSRSQYVGVHRPTLVTIKERFEAYKRGVLQLYLPDSPPPILEGIAPTVFPLPSAVGVSRC